MRNGLTPILFKLKGIASGDGEFGMPPFRPAVLPFVFPTPFGITDSDIKQPPIPLPLLFLPVHGTRHQRIPAHRGRVPQPAQYLRIFGVTKDSTGAVLASCTVKLFETMTDLYVESMVSGADGAYEFRSASLTKAYYVVAYLAGSPDVAGTTVNSLVGG